MTRRLPSGRWQASYTSDGRRYWESFDSKADADAWLAIARAAISTGQWHDPDAGKVRFEDYASQWLADRYGLRPRTKELYLSELNRHLLPGFAGMPLAAITTARIRSWHAEIARSKPVTAAKCYRLLRVILTTAVEDKLLVTNPCVIKKAGQERSSERVVPTLEQIDAVATALPERYRALVYTSAYAGLRLGECAALTRERVDLRGQTIAVIEQAQQVVGKGRVLGQPKSDSGRRVVAIPRVLAVVLEGHIARFVGPEPSALVFTADKGGPLLGQHFARRFAKAREAIGLDWLHFHDLRHFAGTTAAQTGATTREIMARLGHSTPRAALIYQHATAERDHAIADGLDAIIQRAGRTPHRSPPEAVADPGVHGECTPDL
ncbi:MAG: tyrosine-type recombinase/integrase [Acidimicrobiales bacterium]